MSKSFFSRVNFSAPQDEKRKHDSDTRDRRALKGSGEEVRHQRVEEDKHKERKHRDDKDPEKNPRDRTGSKKSASDKSYETNTEKTEVSRTISHLYSLHNTVPVIFC